MSWNMEELEVGTDNGLDEYYYLYDMYIELENYILYKSVTYVTCPYVHK